MNQPPFPRMAAILCRWISSALVPLDLRSIRSLFAAPAFEPPLTCFVRRSDFPRSSPLHRAPVEPPAHIRRIRASLRLRPFPAKSEVRLPFSPQRPVPAHQQWRPAAAPKSPGSWPTSHARTKFLSPHPRHLPATAKSSRASCRGGSHRRRVLPYGTRPPPAAARRPHRPRVLVLPARRRAPFEFPRRCPSRPSVFAAPSIRRN